MWQEMTKRRATVSETLNHVSVDEILERIGKEKTISSIEGKNDETMMFKKLFTLKV